MITRYLPIALGVLTIVGLTIVQIGMTDRFADTNFTAIQRAELLKNVPKSIGDWHGDDMPVDSTVQQTAGAIGAVSRVYRNARTGEAVDLWLIVGHGRPISAHTPNICYRASGFEMRAAESSNYVMSFPGQSDTPFLTNTFFKEDVTGRRLVRVFWTWYNAAEDEDPTTVEWEAPSNSRWHFGNTRALYKMYFTSEMRDPSETAEESPCRRFAQEFLPVVNQALAVVHGDSAPSAPTAEITPPASADSAAATATDTPAEPSADSLDQGPVSEETIDSLFRAPESPEQTKE